MEKENNTATESVQPTAAPAVGIEALIEESAMQGLNGGILLFLKKRDLDFDGPGAVKFAQLITAEFGTVEEAKDYPLSESISGPVREALKSSHDVFCHLYAGGEEDNLRKLIRVIVSGEMLTVMQNKLEEVMKVYNDLK